MQSCLWQFSFIDLNIHGTYNYQFSNSFRARAHYVKLEDAEETARLLAAKEGICCGPSSGAILHVALQRAKEVDRGVMVVMAPDGGEKYLSTELCDEKKCIECFKKYGIS